MIGGISYVSYSWRSVSDGSSGKSLTAGHETVSSSRASSALGRSGFTCGRGRTPRTVINSKGSCSDGSGRLRTSSGVWEIKALTLRPRAAAARRTCFARRSSSELVVRRMPYHNRLHNTREKTGCSATWSDGWEPFLRMAPSREWRRIEPGTSSEVKWEGGHLNQGRRLLILWADRRKGMVIGGLAGDASYCAPLTGPLQVIKQEDI